MMTERLPVLSRIRLTLSLLLLGPASAGAGLTGPANYWECILHGMEDVKNDPVAREVMKICLSDFPDGFSVEEPLEGTPTECILKHGEDVSSALAAQQIHIACNVLYSRP
ncbi:hypothetical protein KW114_13010 [Methylococcus capsulatus]|jgi:hypothetical protein|uniref:Lipoprotein n=1 Tax=Methylococcus capsulatus TaxID=414 RepID=A0AA35V2E3_METCP|nr:hypothetical protein KW112_05915 [Methylococcus capsulatus]QXP89966.1 hypothetical protein KW114_13010 [Methylococcus capsulatus]QXP94319.1 hypothetical protein KW113_03720 [Methylococcus capsulatus]CAI8760431.1 conserved exported protein of unknown function [Methylococcus capsulatus]